MTDLQIANMLADYHKECELAETLREKADVQLKHARLIREALRQPLVSGSLPSKDEVVDKGYTKAKNADYNYRRSLRDLDHDLYFSGWMDCYDWLSGTDR